MSHCHWNTASWIRHVDGRYSVDVKHDLRDHTVVYRWGRHVAAHLEVLHPGVVVEELPARVDKELGFIKITAEGLLHTIDPETFRATVEAAATQAISETATLDARDSDVRREIAQAWAKPAS